MRTAEAKATAAEPVATPTSPDSPIVDSGGAVMVDMPDFISMADVGKTVKPVNPLAEYEGLAVAVLKIGGKEDGTATLDVRAAKAGDDGKYTWAGERKSITVNKRLAGKIIKAATNAPEGKVLLASVVKQGKSLTFA